MTVLFFIALFVGIGINFWYHSRDHAPNYDERNFLGGYPNAFNSIYDHDHYDYHCSANYHSSCSSRGVGSTGRR